MNPRNLSERELLEELVKNQRKSAVFAKIAAIAACTFAALMLIAVVIIVPRFLQAADEINKTVNEVNASVTTMQGLAEEGGNTLAKAEEMIDHLNSLDVDTVNKAIENLEAVTERLRSISGFLGGGE